MTKRKVFLTGGDDMGWAVDEDLKLAREALAPVVDLVDIEQAGDRARSVVGMAADVAPRKTFRKTHHLSCAGRAFQNILPWRNTANPSLWWGLVSLARCKLRNSSRRSGRFRCGSIPRDVNTFRPSAKMTLRGATQGRVEFASDVTLSEAFNGTLKVRT